MDGKRRDDREQPMDAAFAEQPKEAEAFYGTSTPKKEKNSHAGLLIGLCLGLIVISTAYLIVMMLNVRLIRGADGWRITVGAQSGRSAEDARPLAGDPNALDCSGKSCGKPVICFQTDDAESVEQRCAEESGAVVQLNVGCFRQTKRFTGVIITADGYVLSSCGDLSDALSIECALPDGSVQGISYLGSDDQTGLTLLKLAAEGLPTVRFGRMQDDGEGSAFFAGSPDELVQALLNGELLTGIGMDRETGLTLLSTAKQLLKGGYGSPVLDENGRVIGLISMLSEGLADGSVLSVSAEQLQAAVDRILAQNQAMLLWTGFDVGEIPSGLGSYLNCAGALWIRDLIEPETAQEGVWEHDMLLKADGQPLYSVADYLAALARHEPGELMELLLYRNGEYLCASVLVQAR